MTVLLIALAGGLGSCLRYAVAQATAHRAGLGTWVVNLVGSFALAVLVGSTTEPMPLLVVGTGLLGGFTTFSTAAVDSVTAGAGGRPWAAAAHAAVMLLGCVASAGAGLLLA